MILNKRFVDPETGQYETIKLQSSSRRKYSQKGAVKVYTESAFEAIANLSPTEAKFFHQLIKERNLYNIVCKKNTEIVRKLKLNWSNSYTSGRVKKMIDLNLIQKREKRLWINPFIIQPKFDEDNPDNEWEVQQVWKALYDNKDLWNQHIQECYDIYFNLNQ